jgi:hypothetical protein
MKGAKRSCIKGKKNILKNCEMLEGRTVAALVRHNETNTETGNCEKYSKTEKKKENRKMNNGRE